MSWLFSQALVAAYSEENSSGGEPSALSKSMTTPGACLSPDKTTDASNRSQSGTTCEPSMENHGVDWWILSLADSRARISARPMQKRSALEASEAASGGKWQESLVRFCLKSCSWKTLHCLWEEALPSSSVTLPEWGMMRDGVCSALDTPALQSSAIGFGSWVRGPMAKDGRGFYTATLRSAKIRAAGGRTIHWIHQALLSSGWQIGTANPRFSEVLMAWPISWTDLAPLETDKFQQWCASHGIASLEANTPNQKDKRND